MTMYAATNDCLTYFALLVLAMKRMLQEKIHAKANFTAITRVATNPDAKDRHRKIRQYIRGRVCFKKPEHNAQQETIETHTGMMSTS
jgi:hypothetical protein